MSQNAVMHAKGRIQGITESGWTCGDCENVYDASVDHCPNLLLDAANVNLQRELSLQRTYSQAPASADTDLL